MKFIVVQRLKISDQNPKNLDLVIHQVSRLIHLTQMDVIYWLVTSSIIN